MNGMTICRKFVALLLCFCTLVLAGISDLPVRAAEYETRYLEIKRLNDGQIDTYKVLIQDRDILISAGDFARLAGFDSGKIGRSGGALTSIVLANGGDEQKDEEVVISAKAGQIHSVRYGAKDFDGLLDTGDNAYLNLVDMFNYLRIKACVAGNQLLINLPVYTMYDFLKDDYQEVLSNSVSQLDLLEPGEDLKESGKWDAVCLACNNFDFRFLLPGWGTSEILDEQYLKAIQTLNEEDEAFYDDETEEYFQSQMEGRGLGSCLASGKDLINVLSAGGGTLNTVESVADKLENLSEADRDALDSLLDTVNWERSEFLKATGLDSFTEYAGQASDVLTVANFAVSAAAAYDRASGWNEDCLADLDVLRSLDVENYGDHKEYVKRIRKLAEDRYDESSDPEQAAVDQLVGDVADYALEKALMETSVYGQVASLFIFAVNTGVSVARCFGNVAEELDKGELSYMVSCLINIAVASRIDAEVKRAQLNLTQLNSGTALDEFRKSLRTTIKSNLRCWSYIYYLNSDGKWETTDRGKAVKSQIDKMHVYLTLLDETEQYDYALDEYDLITYSPERIEEIAVQDNGLNLSAGDAYDYKNQDLLSSFRLGQETDGSVTASLSFWHNYGNASSDEDFTFEWKDSQSIYSVNGQRSGKAFDITFEKVDENQIRIYVMCPDGYCCWESGERSTLWSDGIYKKADNTSQKIDGITGEWIIDDEKTMDENGTSMFQMFGSAYNDFGSGMTVKEDGTFSYYIGAGWGGEGTWSIQGGGMLYEIDSYEGNDKQSGTIVIDNGGGRTHLIMGLDEMELWWKKK